MNKPLALAALAVSISCTGAAQTTPGSQQLLAGADMMTASTGVIPNAPVPTSAAPSFASSAPVSEDAFAAAADEAQPQMAKKFANVIRPGETAVPLHGKEKAVFALHDTYNPAHVLGLTLSAGWSQLIDSQPHYGTDAGAFGKREGAAALRTTIQTVATDGLFSPMFHDDPRYYMMGDGHPFVHRVVYAATRVLVVRSSHSMQNRLNAPLLLGYGVTAAANNLYYPDQDRGGSHTLQNWASSLAGAALGFEINEFADDALRMLHLKRR